MGRHEFNAVMRAIAQLSWSQRRQLLAGLQATQAAQEVGGLIEQRLQWLPACPHGCGARVMRNGVARGLQRWRCTPCGRSFNALTGTPLAGLRRRELWLEQAQALLDGLSVSRAAQRLQVARSTAFRWRHRFLALPQHVKAGYLQGIVEADETCILKSCKGQPQQLQALRRQPRRRGGRASVRGMSQQHDVVLVVCDRSGAVTDHVVAALDTAHLAAVLQPVVAADAVLCTDGAAALAAAAAHLRIEHHALNASAAQRRIGPWHINNVNGYHSRLKHWLRRFKGVASSYLPRYLGWFRTLERFRPTPLTPSALLALAIGV